MHRVKECFKKIMIKFGGKKNWGSYSSTYFSQICFSLWFQKQLVPFWKRPKRQAWLGAKYVTTLEFHDPLHPAPHHPLVTVVWRQFTKTVPTGPKYWDSRKILLVIHLLISGEHGLAFSFTVPSLECLSPSSLTHPLFHLIPKQLFPIELYCLPTFIQSTLGPRSRRQEGV